ncbi:hypothetical protein ACLKA7_012055 [Drosophila subpalustris]
MIDLAHELRPLQVHWPMHMDDGEAVSSFEASTGTTYNEKCRDYAEVRPIQVQALAWRLIILQPQQTPMEPQQQPQQAPPQPQPPLATQQTRG